MRQWYYLMGDEQAGPVAFEELRHLIHEGRVTERTLVWKSGLEDWTAAGEIPGLFASAPPAAAPGPVPGSLPYVDTHLTKAILATVLGFLFCCFPLGIVAIVKAAQVKGRLEAGDVEGARRISREANSWGNWSLAIVLLGLFAYFCLILLAVLFGGD